MKKIILCLCLAVMLTIIQISEAAVKNPQRRGNDKAHLVAAEKISALEGVGEAAVISCDGQTLVGVRLADVNVFDEVMGQTESIIKEVFPEIRKLRIFVGDDKAKNIVELSFYVDAGMDREVLEKRFRYLAEINQGI